MKTHKKIKNALKCATNLKIMNDSTKHFNSCKTCQMLFTKQKEEECKATAKAATKKCSCGRAALVLYKSKHEICYGCAEQLLYEDAFKNGTLKEIFLKEKKIIN
jgi:hypothetical protein